MHPFSFSSTATKYAISHGNVSKFTIFPQIIKYFFINFALTKQRVSNPEKGNMTIHEAIIARHSVRKYIDKPIEENLIKILQEKVNECNNLGNLHIQLVTNEPKAFKGKMAYGTFSGVSKTTILL